MPVPTFDQLMLPLLRLAADGDEHATREVVQTLADFLHLSDAERTELLPSGVRRKFDDRVQWAKNYLRQARLLERTGRGKFRITRRGIRVLNENPSHIDTAYLKQFPEFEAYLLEARLRRNNDYELLSHKSPRALIESSYENLRVDLADDLLNTVMAASPEFFERLVIDLLLALGYGDTKESGYVLGRSGDGGVDGYIQEDKLGLNRIYVQAKRYAKDSPVGRPAIQGFVGSLLGIGANRGVFLTTSRFSRDALEYATSVQNVKIILIDGKQLTQLMIDHDVGVSAEKTYVVKRINTDYFDTD
jgi:restriction system protein